MIAKVYRLESKLYQGQKPHKQQGSFAGIFNKPTFLTRVSNQ